jgi:hypothetical protein
LTTLQTINKMQLYLYYNLSGRTGCEFYIGEGWVAQLVELRVKELEVQRSSSSKEKTNNITINVLTIFHSKRKKKGCEFYMHKLG